MSRKTFSFAPAPAQRMQPLTPQQQENLRLQMQGLREAQRALLDAISETYGPGAVVEEG